MWGNFGGESQNESQLNPVRCPISLSGPQEFLWKADAPVRFKNLEITAPLLRRLNTNRGTIEACRCADVDREI